MKRMISLLLAAAAVLGLLSGCGGDTQTTTSGASETAASVQASAAPENTAAPTEAPAADPASAMESVEAAEEPDIPQISYPLTEEDVTLTYWQAWPPFLSSYCSLADCKTFAKLEEITGIHLDFVEVDSESAGEKFNLMVTASACTDLVQGGVQRYTGGGTQAIMDEVFYDLAPYVAEYMPNYNAAIGDDENIRKALVDDEGQMAQICGIYNDYYYQDQGMWVRQDFLDQLKLVCSHIGTSGNLMQDDGSRELEWRIELSELPEGQRLNDGATVVTVEGNQGVFHYAADVDPQEQIIEGNWTLAVTLPKSDTTQPVGAQQNAEFTGDLNFTVEDIRVTADSLQFQLVAPSNDYVIVGTDMLELAKAAEPDAPFYSVEALLKDGTSVPTTGGSMSYDEESGMDEWSIQWVAPIDPETVTALIFSDGTTQQEIPLES